MAVHRVVTAVSSLALLTLALAPGRAEAALTHRGFVELAGGAHVPVYGDRYQEMFNSGPMLELRGGAFQAPDPGQKHAFALEFAFAWVHLRDDVADLPDQTYDFDEFHCLFGARWMYFVRPELHLYTRIAGGVEVLAIGGTNTLAGSTVATSKSNAGVAAQLGLGASWRISSFDVGAEVAVPWSMHENEGEGGSRYDVNTSYDSLSVDLLLTVSTRI